jgi:hypothetical protein
MCDENCPIFVTSFLLSRSQSFDWDKESLIRQCPAEPEIPWRVSHPSIIQAQLLNFSARKGTGVSNMVNPLIIFVKFSNVIIWWIVPPTEVLYLHDNVDLDALRCNLFLQKELFLI